MSESKIVSFYSREKNQYTDTMNDGCKIYLRYLRFPQDMTPREASFYLI